MKFYMAPLESITGYVYRNAYHSFFHPMDKYFTPFIVAKKQKGKLFDYREKNDILPEHNRGMRVIPQILTNCAEDFLRTVQGLEEYGYQEVNLNLGCPSKPVVNRGKGSGFLEHPEELRRFLDNIFANTTVKISIKTRLGRLTPDGFGDLLKLFNQYPLEELIVHPRIQTDYYKNTPNMEFFDLALSESVHPVCYNGDIFTETDYRTLTEKRPQLEAVMLGRGVLANPALAGQLCTLDTDPFSLQKRYDKKRWIAFHDRIYADYREISVNDEKALFKMKELWCYMIYLFSNHASCGRAIKLATNLPEYEEAVSRLFEQENLVPGTGYPKPR